MANISRKNNKLNISSKDLKKAVVDANNRLKKSNDNLSSRIKDAEKLVKSKDKELKDFDKKFKTKLKEIDASEKYATKLRADIYSLEKESSKLNEVIKKLKGDESSRNKNIKKFDSIKGVLEDVIAGLELRKEKAEKIVKDIGNIEIRKSVAQSDLNKLFKSISLEQSKIKNIEKSKSDISNDFKEFKDSLRIEKNTLILDIDCIKDKLKAKEFELEKITSDLDEKISDKNSELKAVSSLVDKAENEYIAYEGKIKKAQGEVDMKKREVQTVKDAYEKWRINQLEQVAKLKLKNKIDKINKAGLSEILGNG